jgi:eukaryotic-like serine/threonine-protein kinase
MWRGNVLNGRYRVERVIGSGGTWLVVAAIHLRLGQRVALKFLLPEAMSHREAVERLPRRARAAAQLRSDHVARIIDVDALPSGAPFVVMEYLDGIDLATALRRDGALPVPAIAEHVIQALDAIGEAHAAGIVHRDLEPKNLLVVRRSDGSAWIKVVDLGIAGAVAAVADTGTTGSQPVIRSPAYRSPEDLRAEGPVDARSDIWSLGVILYELATGRVPFGSGVLSELALEVVTDPTPPMESPHQLPDGFEAVVRRCLEKDPARRFQTAADLAAALAPFSRLRDPAGPRPDRAGRRR